MLPKDGYASIRRAAIAAIYNIAILSHIDGALRIQTHKSMNNSLMEGRPSLVSWHKQEANRSAVVYYIRSICYGQVRG